MKSALLVGALVAAASASCSSKSDPGPTAATKTLDRNRLLDPVTCKECHADHYADWASSMHAYAAEDPVFLAMNRRAQRETGGAVGSACVACHAPMALREGATTDGTNLESVPSHLKGVTCYFCHLVDAVTGTHDAALHLADDGVLRGAISDPVAGKVHGAAYSPLHDGARPESSALCGACHDVQTGHGAMVERTFADYGASPYAHDGGKSCSSCHFPAASAPTPVASFPGAPPRALHAHTAPGVDLAATPFGDTGRQRQQVQELLDATLDAAICVGTQNGATRIRVVLDDVGAAHPFPSGAAQDRRAWVELVASSAGSTIYASGVVAAGASVVASADPDLWLFRDCVFDAGGGQTSSFWSAASFEPGALPMRSTLDANDPKIRASRRMQAYPRTGTIMGTPDKVTMRVRLRAIGLDVLDELVASGDLAASVRDAAPTLDVGPTLEWTRAAATTSYVDGGVTFACKVTKGFDVRGDETPAEARTRCKP